MIVPGFIVSRIYRKGSLRREDNGYYSFSFKNTVARGTATLTAPNRILVKSTVGSIELSRFPELFVDGEPVHKEDAMMVIGGQEIPHYDEEEAKKRVGESIAFEKGDDFITRIRGNIADGFHVFRAVFHSTQFGEITLNFKDYIGGISRPSIWDRMRERLGRLIPSHRTAARDVEEMQVVADSRLYIIESSKPDPDFGRLLTALGRKEPDRVPLIELAVDEEVKTAFLGRPVTSMRDEVEFWLATGYDYVPLFLLNTTPRNLSVIDSHRTTYKEGLQERAWVIESKGAIITEEDFESCEWPEIHDALFASFDEVGRYLPPEMRVIGCISAVFEIVTQAMGLEAFCMSLYDKPHLIEAMFQRTGTLIAQCIERMLQYEYVGAVWIADDLAYHQGPMISPAMLRKYVFPWHKKYIDMVHAKGLPVLLHSCGNTMMLLEDIIEAGFDALHPVEATAMDIYQTKEMIGDRIALCGNIDLSYMLTRSSAEEVVEDVKDHVRRLGPCGGYCLGSSNSIPNYVPMHLYLAMNRACLEFGRYPISV